MTILAVENLLEILGSIGEAELSFGRFYRQCAETWEADEEFWLNLEAEEIKHARIIGEMAELIRQNPGLFQLNRPFNVTAVRTVISGIEQNIEKLAKGLITRERAMVLARDIESSIIEKTYHEIVKTADLTYLTLVRQVVSDTHRHRSDIEKKIRDCAAPGPVPKR